MPRMLWCGALALALSAAASSSQAWEKRYTVEHRVGDNETRNSARLAAIGQVRLLAASEAGAYVQGLSEIRDGHLTETITQLSLTHVAVTVESDALHVSEDGASVLTLEAHARVDERRLEKQINALRDDRRDTRLMTQLARDNERLQRAALSAADEGQGALGPSASLLAQVAARAPRIDAQKRLFSAPQPQDVSLQLAEAQAQASDQLRDFGHLRQRWQAEVFDPMSQVQVDLRITRLTLSADGEHYDGELRARWDLRGKASQTFLCAWVTCGEQGSSLYLSLPLRDGGYSSTATADEIHRFVHDLFGDYDATLRIAFAGYTWDRPLMTASRFHSPHHFTKTLTLLGDLTIPFRVPVAVAHETPTLHYTVVHSRDMAARGHASASARWANR